jgi:hypothetical protein
MKDTTRQRITDVVGRVIVLFGRIPVVGELTRCSWLHHASALREFVVLIIFSTAAFWLAAFIALFLQDNKGVKYLDLLQRTLENGELTIFCVSMLGPIFYTALDNPAWAKRDFPEKIIHAVVAVLVAIGASSLFAVSRVPIPKNPELIILWSFILASIALVLRYLTVLYAKARQDDPAEVWRTSAQSFISQALQRKHSQ